MVEGGVVKQMTSLLSNAELARIEQLTLNASRLFTNKSRGEHLAGKGGSSTDFSDYRDYTPGDDVRFVDWNIFSRLHRPYLKLYHQEEEMHVLLLVDTSESMRFEGKFTRACQLAAAFGLMGLLNSEKVSVCAAGDNNHALKRLRPCTGRASMNKLFTFLQELECGGTLPLEAQVEQVMQHHSGRGVVILLSDFLTGGDLTRAFNQLFSAGLELFALQILSPSEIDPAVTGDLRLVDSETDSTLDISSAGDLVSLYHEYRLALEGTVHELCRKRGGRFVTSSSEEPLTRLLFERLQRKGWVK